MAKDDDKNKPKSILDRIKIPGTGFSPEWFRILNIAHALTPGMSSINSGHSDQDQVGDGKEPQYGLGDGTKKYEGMFLSQKSVAEPAWSDFGGPIRDHEGRIYENELPLSADVMEAFERARILQELGALQGELEPNYSESKFVDPMIGFEDPKQRWREEPEEKGDLKLLLIKKPDRENFSFPIIKDLLGNPNIINEKMTHKILPSEEGFRDKRPLGGIPSIEKHVFGTNLAPTKYEFKVRPADAPEDAPYDIAVVELANDQGSYFSGKLPINQHKAQKILERLGFDVLEEDNPTDYLGRNTSIRQESMINIVRNPDAEKSYFLRERVNEESVSVDELKLKKLDTELYGPTVDFVDIPREVGSDEANVVYIRELFVTEAIQRSYSDFEITIPKKF